MAGRGRGQGRRMLSFSVEAVGINRGDNLPPSIQQPTPLFPVMEQKPLPLASGEEAEYLLALKQEFRGAMKSLPFFIQPAAARRDVERYSDKYHSSEQSDSLTDWIQDWKRLPKELRLHVKKTPKTPKPGVPVAASEPNKVQSGQRKKKVKEKEEVLLKLETLEKKEEQQSSEEEEGEEKKKQEEEEAEVEEEYDEEEFEEETDYIMSYFDNGEDFGGDSDDNMDEAIY